LGDDDVPVKDRNLEEKRSNGADGMICMSVKNKKLGGIEFLART